MTPDLSQIDFYKVLFWVIIVLVAGFIGQFGKSFATYVMNRLRKKPPQPVRQEQSGQGGNGKFQGQAAAPSIAPAMPEEESKIRKKELKAELKRNKKDIK
jgi:hypothetical protein